MFSNYTLPTKKTHPTDIFDYDEPIHPRVTAEPIVLHDENKIQKRFSLAIVERIKQHHLRARTVDTSFLKYLVKPYKYSTTSLYSTVGTPASTTYFPGYHMYITTSPRTTTEAVSIEIKKVETINMNLNEDAFDMDMDFDYPDTNLATEAAKENKQEFYTTLSSHSKTLGISPKVESRQVNNFKEIQNVGNEEKTIPTRNNTFSTQSSSSKGSSKEIEKTSKENNIHNHLKKRDITAKPDKTRTVNKNSINAKKIQSTKMSNTTERTYLKLKNMLLKRLNKTITTKLIQLYTFKTRKIPITRKRNLIISTKCENPVKKTRAITNMNYILHGDKLGVTMKTTEKKKNLKIKINATQKKLKLKKVRSTKKTNNDKLADDNNLNIEYGNRFKDNKNHWTTLQFISSTDNATKSQRKSKKTKAEVREELLHELYPPVTLSDEVYHDQEHRSEYKDCVKEPTQQYIDSNEKSDNPKKKRKKTKEEEFLNLMYPPVTLNEEWERAYENILIPTIPQNMSRDEYIRGFYTYGIEDVITTTVQQ
ncbi:uncharacterized protein LOC113466040 [Diaphorina citri]|uniref:Uncharacterized protein LOC113466040 n=1 Tax=Diaphorina citri TaxID=121845 RepID=A0A3Q0IQJ8_DIACI|nr:uncharacterized protein LOC113466040 [Diaphorina citri]